jgi:hypothetical protein
MNVAERRRMLALVVLLGGASPLLLASCATPDVACNIRADYRAVTAVPHSGIANVSWRYDAQLGQNVRGDALCVETSAGRQCHLRFVGKPPEFTDVCGMARLGHEFLHAFGAAHER